jgi:hypothetical protein
LLSLKEAKTATVPCSERLPQTGPEPEITSKAPSSERGMRADDGARKGELAFEIGRCSAYGCWLTNNQRRIVRRYGRKGHDVFSRATSFRQKRERGGQPANERVKLN